MASDLKRRRRPVTYKEPSTDDDSFDDDLDDQHTSGKKLAVPQRRSKRIRTSTPEAGPSRALQGDAPVETAKPLDTPRTLQLREKGRISYRETSDNEGDDDEQAFEAEDYEPEALPTSSHPNRGTPATKTRNRTRHRKSRTKRIRPFGGSAKSKTSTRSPSPDIPSDGKIPPWANLPYHVLLQIFVYSAHPLHDDNFNPMPSISWLAKTARLCTAFAKPALTALYRNPPIFALKQNRRALVEHLASPPASGYADYAVMVKRLEIDPSKMSKLTDPQTSVTYLAELIKSLRTLNDVDIFDPKDQPPYRESSKDSRRWRYPPELFAALSAQSELRLRSWRWNSAYCSQGPLWMKDIHDTTAFQTIKDLNLTKFHEDEKEPTDDGPTREELLGSALAALPNLRTLTFETCSILNKRLFPLLPHGLVSLNITNCRNVTSEDLQAFLTTHGNRVQELTLNHNQCLNLQFLTTLKANCPHLESLRMDTHYYNTLSTTSDNEPLYDALLEEGDVPTWPSTLCTIDMEFLRNWTPTAAIAFFTSLIDSANDLPWLRELTITAIVDIDWRQRAEFRKKWTSRFQKVFARPWTVPDPSLVSLRAYREFLQAQTPTKNEKSKAGYEDVPLGASPSADESGSDRPLLKRTSARTNTRSNAQRNDSPNPRSSPSSKSRWNAKRLRSRAKPAYDDPSSGDDESGPGSDGGAAESDAEDVPFIQGRCYKVLFKVDNSRPQETIYDEEDFLDDEVTGDEDWNGEDVVDEGYAW